MTFLPYSFNFAFQSLLKEKWINLLSALSIASGLLIISIVFFVGYNIDSAARRLPEKFSMILYLEQDIRKEKIDPLIASLKKHNSVRSVRYIPKEEAMKELRSLLKDSGYVFEGLDENPLSDSLDLKLTSDAIATGTAKKLANEFLRLRGVKEVDYGDKFLSSLQALQSGLKVAGLVLILVLSSGIIFVCYSTVKILFYRRSEEIETFKLLGATRWFIRTPFLIEGSAIGALGGIISLGGIFAFYFFVLLRLGASFPLLKSVIFPSTVFLSLPLVGMVLGIAGASFALGRLRY